MTVFDWSRVGVRPPRDWAVRYRLRPYDRREKQCPRCGSMKVLAPWTSAVVLCRRCAARWALIDELARRGRAGIAYNLGGTLECMECGARELVMVVVEPERLCVDCMWYGLARRRTRLKVDGVRW